MKTNGIPTVRDLLSEGFGAEDIALKLRVPAARCGAGPGQLRAPGGREDGGMTRAPRTPWTDQMMLDALALRDRHGMSASQIGKVLGVSRSAVLGIFKRIADDEAKAKGE